MNEEYVTVSNCDRKHNDIMSKLNEINDRLYKDNGKLSIQTRLDRGDRIIGVLCWVTTVAGGAVIVSAVAFLWKVVLHVGVK